MGPGDNDFWKYLLVYDSPDSDEPAPPGCAKGCVLTLAIAGAALVLLLVAALTGH